MLTQSTLIIASVLILFSIFVTLNQVLGSKPPMLSFNVSYKGATFEGTKTMILNNEQKVRVELDVRTAAGNPAPIDGDPLWESSDDAVAHVEVDADNPNAAWVTSVAPGTAQISVRVDADMGENVREIIGNLDITVIESEAAIIQIVAGEPELK